MFSQHEVVVSIGSNFGDRKSMVGMAIDWLSKELSDFRSSRIYETPSEGHVGSNYMNAVCEGVTRMSRENLENLCKEYERCAGRDSECRAKGNVPIDLDIVIYDGEVVRPTDYRRSFFKIGFGELR